MAHTESQAFFGGLIHRELMYGITFVSRVFNICDLYLKKEEWNKTKEKQHSGSKMPYY